MTIAIFGNAQKPATITEVAHLLEFMNEHKVHVYLSQELRQEMNLREYPAFPSEWELIDGAWVPSHGEVIDFALSIGGDGTFLTTASAIADKNIPILGINSGHLGFLADVQICDVDAILDRLLRGDYSIEQRSLLQVTPGEGGHILANNALNEVAVMKQSLSSMITVETSLNGEHLNSYEADGLVIATATGSTAYNLSVGGPLMVPQAKGILLSPIAGHSLTVRPLAIPDNWMIDLKIKSRNGNYLVSVDGRSQVMADTVTLHIERAPYTIKVVQVGNNSFLNSLKTKLGWGR